MIPGDTFLVSRIAYGVPIPFSRKVAYPLRNPSRGEVIVFRYPAYPSTVFVSRVIGLPGDNIAYSKRVLYINGERVRNMQSGEQDGAKLYYESLGSVTHEILLQPQYPSINAKLTVPDRHLFVMGDNRDNSRDSRYLGTVPRENVIGRVSLVVMNWSEQTGFVPGRMLKMVR